jgi:hypothetical protein
MLDVIHVFYEEDITPLYEQHQEVKDSVRNQLYPLLYNRPYNYASKQTYAGTRGEGWESEAKTPVRSNETKPYIPPTPIEDLPGILAPPLS